MVDLCLLRLIWDQVESQIVFSQIDLMPQGDDPVKVGSLITQPTKSKLNTNWRQNAYIGGESRIRQSKGYSP